MSFAQSMIKSVLYRMGYSVKKLRAPQQRVVEAAGRDALPPDALMSALHQVNPYEDFAYADYEMDARGWGSDSPAFAQFVKEAEQLSLVVEVGTWKGGSALQLGKALSESHPGARILCIDTWLGALEFWTDQKDPNRFGGLGLKYGYPTVYYQFLANVCHAGLQDRVIPFPQTSATAALWLRSHGVRSELIYIDGSHEEEDVYQDLNDYWEVLAPGGVIFGDDYTWDGVRLAVQRFSREKSLEIEFREDKWSLNHA
ncbi:MAG: class I SAM-dependent methyltransferase [Verrucomicrobiota bacterium]